MPSKNIFHRGNVNEGTFAPFQYDEPGMPPQTFGDISTVRMEGSDGTTLAVGLWVVKESSTSPIYTSQLGDETFLVLEGEVDVHDLDTGEVHHFKKGDFCSWSKGMRTRWTIRGPFKKFFAVAGRG